MSEEGGKDRSPTETQNAKISRIQGLVLGRNAKRL